MHATWILYRTVLFKLSLRLSLDGQSIFFSFLEMDIQLYIIGLQIL